MVIILMIKVYGPGLERLLKPLTLVDELSILTSRSMIRMGIRFQLDSLMLVLFWVSNWGTIWLKEMC